MTGHLVVDTVPPPGALAVQSVWPHSPPGTQQPSPPLVYHWRVGGAPSQPTTALPDHCRREEASQSNRRLTDLSTVQDMSSVSPHIPSIVVHHAQCLCGSQHMQELCTPLTSSFSSSSSLQHGHTQHTVSLRCPLSLQLTYEFDALLYCSIILTFQGTHLQTDGQLSQCSHPVSTY